MTNHQPQEQPPHPSRKLDHQQYARLRAEIKAPYRGLRKFVYIAFAASGLIGGFIFLIRIVAGRDVDDALPNFALQVGVVALMIWLFRLESQAERKQ
ncbi:MAG: DUF3493 domain-containing protein [Leptolyngbyaceae cyanobacterium RU_5_1]|nr:DUF3493 domain-containing protein [Leptolyngbyaceae cyanobacterium RU_5_1]